MKSFLPSLSCIVLLGLGSAFGQWKIPDPKTTEHPGAKEALPSSPTTYPDEAGFERRSKLIIGSVATRDLSTWRKGFFEKNDPGKYVPGVVMARLLLDPDDAEARKYMNDDRSFAEHYHFAAVNWGRFYPIFGETVLTEETKEKVDAAAAEYAPYLPPHTGTENHRTMWWTTANVLPHFLPGSTFAKKDDEEALKLAKEHLRKYVKGLYAAGQGEWDSSTYLPFDLNGMLNIYDFSPDAEARLLAKAALDWYVTSYALKFTNGIFCAPHQRGYAGSPFSSLMDHIGYLWWGGMFSPEKPEEFLFTIQSITSAYRPNIVLTNLANRRLKGLPAEFRNTKPNYWHGHGTEPVAGKFHESLYIDNAFTMGSLWDGHRSQLHRFQIVLRLEDGGAVALSGGHPRKSDHKGVKGGEGYADGSGRYIQSAQIGTTYLAMAKVPEDDPLDALYITLPTGAEVEELGAWRIVRVSGTPVAIAIRAFGGEIEAGPNVVLPKKLEAETLLVRGRTDGFVVEILSDGDPNVLRNTKLSIAKLENLEVSYTTHGGTKIDFAFNPAPEGDEHGERMANVSVDGKPVEWPNAIYDGPFAQQKDGILTVTDGENAYTVDFSGDLPVYRKDP